MIVLWQVLGGLAYSVAGFGVGFVLGRVTREVHEIRETIVPETETEQPQTRRGSKLGRWSQQRTLGVVLIVLALSSVSVTFYAATEQRRVTDCQATYNAAFTDALSVRNEVAARDRQALITLTNTLLKPGATSGTQLAAVSAYNQTLRTSEQQRAANPLPAPKPCQ